MTPDAEVKSDDKALPTVTSGQPHLSRQDLSTLDITKLTPLSPEHQPLVDRNQLADTAEIQLLNFTCLVFGHCFNFTCYLQVTVV